MVSSMPEKDPTALTFDDLLHGFPHVPSEGGAMMAQAAGTTRRINSRLRARLGQTRQSDNLALTAYVVVVESGTPRAKVVQR